VSIDCSRSNPERIKEFSMGVQTAPTIAHGQQEVRLTGRSIAPGLGMGQAWVVGDVLRFDGAQQTIDADEVDRECVRLRHCFEETFAELEQSARRIESEFDSALAGIFRAHGTMLRGLVESGEFERELRTSSLTAESAVRRVLNRWYQKFEALENRTLRERADDVLDLGRSIIQRLRGEADAGLQSIPENSVLVVERLMPSDVVRLPKARVAAIVVESLGQGSHAALLAREKSIPTITEIPGVLSLVAGGSEVLVDGHRGTLVIAPQSATRDDFEERLNAWRATLVRCKDACRKPARTLDGQLIRVEANIGIQEDVELALDNGADGVGLLRIEQLYFARQVPPTEDELFVDLQRLVTPLRDRPVTVRLLDIGGDKPLPFLRLASTSNPVLGRRGVRVLLEYSQLVRTQMGAILRLSQEHPVSVLIPMITLEEDVQRMREMFDTTSTERKITRPPKFGAMIETPAAALAVPMILKHADFLCVGTNDLTQYTLAAARDDASVNAYFQDSHESVLRLLQIVLADAGGRPVTLCGELAGRQAWVPRLLQMGFRTLSVAPTVIPVTKEAIRGVNLGAVRASTNS
jgi:phosphoenolpyruvate-protein phosphotransferase (PTS system enzyme I)